MLRVDKINDFVVRFANVNGTGSASANFLFAKAIFRMGIPVTPKNIFPSNLSMTSVPLQNKSIETAA